jgi:hypothetical protein
MDNATLTTKPKLPKVPDKALEALKEGIQSVLSSKDWSGFLSAIRKIHSYSFNNRMLIMLGQSKRGWDLSSLVAGKTKWNTEFNRQIKTDEFTKPIWIIAPVVIDKKDENGNPIKRADGSTEKIAIRFRGVKVYDHRQTHGDPIPDPDTTGMMDQLNDTAPAQLLSSLVAVAKARNVAVYDSVPKEELGGAHGRCWFENAGRASKIEILDELNLTTKIGVLAHELGHAILHNRDEYQEHDDASIKELEAESVAYLVCSYYGVDLGNRSFRYIVHHDYASDDVVADLLKSGDRIFKAYSEIISVVDPKLEEFGLKPRSAV